MANRGPNHWDELQKVDVDIGELVSGASDFNAEYAVNAVKGRPGVEVEQAAIPPETHDLFLQGRIGDPVSAPPEQILTAVVGQLASDELGVTSGAANVRIKHSEQSIGGAHVKAEQMIEDLPVYGSEINVHLDDQGQAFAVTGRPYPKALGASLDRPQRPHPNPVAVASEYLGLPLDPTNAAVSQVALPVEGRFLACWQVKAPTRDPFGDWTAMVSFDGQPLFVYNTASALHGEADLFLENPFRGPSQRWRLDDLNPPGPNALKGAYARVTNLAVADATSQQGAFVYPQNDLAFDDPNVYFFLDQARKSFEMLNPTPFWASESLFAKPNFAPMRGFTHDAGAVNNAFYSPSTGYLYFGDVIELASGTVTGYTSRSRDIAIHEFGHAVSDSVCRLGRTIRHTQSRGMSEGYSDYFACSFLDNPIMGDDFVKDPAGMRRCDNNKPFPAGFVGVEHDVGEVWAGFLWSLRSDPDVGRGITDVLALKSLYFLGPWRTIFQGVAAIILADRVLFPTSPALTQGRHEQRIRDHFDDRRP